ncbi:MAG TPA: HEAT repeat domain-containing protein [Pyrinomonadaceae bacterium]|nr:HEAT repeat domain-containing protein [Pyrinomonadaceae bacterium]
MTHSNQPKHRARLFKGALACAAVAIALTLAPARAGAQSRELLNRLFQSGGGSDASLRVLDYGRTLIDAQKWEQAASAFDRFIVQYPSDKNLDAALFWLAYAHNRQGNYQAAYDSLTRFFRQFPRSSWADDAQALRVEVLAKLRPGTPVDVPEDGPDDLKIIALRALCENDKASCAARAGEVLRSNNSSRVKEAAIILLARYGGGEAVPTLIQLARSEPDAKLRTRAIRALGETNDERALDVLHALALEPAGEGQSRTPGPLVRARGRFSDDDSPSDAALNALMNHESPRATSILGDVAVNGKTVGTRTRAVEMLAHRRGENVVDELLRLYDAVPDLQTKKYVVAALGNRRDPRALNKLLDIARNAPDVSLRMQAIHAIPNRGEEQDLDVLISLYDSERNDELKLSLLSSLGRYRNQRAYQKLEQIVTNTAEPIERRKVAISLLGNSKDPEVIKFLTGILNK